MIPLSQIEIAKPCHESWDNMAGDGAVRFCSQCSRNVYNLSDMTAEQAQALVTKTEGQLCVRFYRRKDGTMMTSDCPVGVRIARQRVAAVRSWAASFAIAALTGTALFGASRPQATMGAPMAFPATDHQAKVLVKHTKAASKSGVVVKKHITKRPSASAVVKSVSPSVKKKPEGAYLMGTPPPAPLEMPHDKKP